MNPIVCISLKNVRESLKLFLEDNYLSGRLYTNNQQFIWKVYRQKLPDVDFEDLAQADIKDLEDFRDFRLGRWIR